MCKVKSVHFSSVKHILYIIVSVQCVKFRVYNFTRVDYTLYRIVSFTVYSVACTLCIVLSILCV